jgi:hypothetical protein
MAKAARKNITKAKSKTAPREGLAFIDASYQRKTSSEPNLKRELRRLRRPEDVQSLTALYDAYKAAAEVILGIENQPRAQGIEDLLEAEGGRLIAKAWTVAEALKTLRPTKSGHDRENFVRVLVDCAFEMGGNVDDAFSVFKAAMAVSVSPTKETLRESA